jgi:hypothetical protein
VNHTPGFVPVDDGGDGLDSPEADDETDAEDEGKGDYLSGSFTREYLPNLLSKVWNGYGTSIQSRKRLYLIRDRLFLIGP